MSELLGKAGGLGKYSEIWRGAETQPGGEFRHSSDPNCTFCCYKRFFFNLSNTTNTAQSSSVLHDATEKYY